ncbi:MAG: aminopeptidase, partial [Flammeovirgaceae bacterium]|nr:aminopeptidase [Flammeovirgaceae bacterium]MDW8287302.1 aminopeptidase [Flammeovirgaceae bacterium]
TLASTIIHELTHGTIFIRNDISFNENLATFVGDEGAIRFLKHYYNENTLPLRKFLQKQADKEAFANFVLRAAVYLDSVYQSFPPSFSEEDKKTAKQKAIHHIVSQLDTMQFFNPLYCRYFEKGLPNNTFFMGFRRYREKQKELKKTLENDFQGDLKRYIGFYKQKYPSFFQ